MLLDLVCNQQNKGCAFMKEFVSYIKEFVISTEGTSTPTPIFVFGILLIIGTIGGVILSILKLFNTF